ncbi:MAG: MaoC/PaaZ C-terminal domain-containing protein [Rhodospirillales bacterium]|nr:MaoC/PaaZ C-terminal domain-containing protein [Rhodospirillales bacterium]
MLAVPPGPLALSDWISIDQDRVEAFGAATHHTHWLHTDPERAQAESPYGGTVAHGFLVLSLINHAIDQCALRPSDSAYALNYGVDRVRFLKPMPIGSGFRVRDRITLIEAEMRETGLFTRTGHAFEIKGDDSGKPCVVAEYLSVWVAA